ncbi:MAG: N-acetyltransferase [Pseudomonadota bacterium]
MNIRRLTPEDLPLFRAVNQLFANVFEMPEEYGGSPPDDVYVHRLLGKPHVIILAAMEGEEVIGALTAYELEKFEQARSEIYIYDLAVLEAHRCRGVASALIEQTRTIARQCGAWTVFVQADWDDTAPVTLYTKLGHREDVHHFDIKP